MFPLNTPNAVDTPKGPPVLICVHTVTQCKATQRDGMQHKARHSTTWRGNARCLDCCKRMVADDCILNIRKKLADDNNTCNSIVVGVDAKGLEFLDTMIAPSSARTRCCIFQGGGFRKKIYIQDAVGYDILRPPVPQLGQLVKHMCGLIIRAHSFRHNVTSSTKPEVHNVLQATAAHNMYRKFCEVETLFSR